MENQKNLFPDQRSKKEIIQDKIKKDYQIRTGRSNPQDMIFTLEGMSEKSEIVKSRRKWSKNFHKGI